MKEIIAFVRNVPEEEVGSVHQMYTEGVSSTYFHPAFRHLRDMGFHGGEIVFVKDDGSPVENSRIRINCHEKLIDQDITKWES